MKKVTFTQSQAEDDKALQQAFSEPYIDANRFVPRIVANITSDVNNYHANPGDYNVPYTSVVTSSLMGKSRLLKEMARCQPSVYICLRPKDASGYPKRSDVIADYLLEAGSSSLPKKSYRNQIKYDHNAFSTAKYALFLLHLIVGLKVLIQSPPETLAHRNPSFFWEYFAETPEELNTHLTTFWNGVKTEAGKQLAELATSDKLTNFSKTFDIGGKLNDAFEEFRKEYLRLGYSIDPNFSILLLFDEARYLCQTTAFNGRKIYTIQEFILSRRMNAKNWSTATLKTAFPAFWHYVGPFARPKSLGKLIPAPHYSDCLPTLRLASGIFNRRNRMIIPSAHSETLNTTLANYSFPRSIVLLQSMRLPDPLRILFRTRVPWQPLRG